MSSAKIYRSIVICVTSIFGSFIFLWLFSFPVPAHAQEPTFSTIRSFGGAHSTRGAALGDLNGDGFLDIVTAHVNNGQNYIYLNDGEGNFSSGSSFGTNSATIVALGDLNGDGFLDIVTGNWAEPNIVYLNDGDGNFSSGNSFGGTNQTWSVALGDLDGDDFLDIVTGNRGEQNYVYLNDGEGNFSSGSPFSGSNETWGVALGDMDGDGLCDIVTGNSGENYVYLNNGGGDFSSGSIFGSGSTESVALGDLDGDGLLDIVIGNRGANYVYLNNGGGGFSSGFSFGTDETRTVALGDLDGDGLLDIVTGNWTGANYVYLNNGGGSFSSGSPFEDSDNGTQSVALGDMDGDGFLDIVTGNYGENSVYLNDGGGSFSSGSALSARNDAWSVALGDLDGDGLLDIVTGNNGPNYVYLNDGGGGFSSGSSFSTDETRTVALGDLDDDGFLDIVTGNYQEQNYVYLNDGGGGFSSGFSFGGPNETQSVALGDLDGDGFLDIVTGNWGANYIYLNDGEGGFSSGSSFGGANWTNSVALGDLDGNGFLDVVTGNRWGSNYIYLNDGGGGFSSGSSFGGMNYTKSVALNDLDGDGFLDIVTGNWGANYIYLNDGKGGFSSGSSFGGANSTVSVTLGDLDGDGFIDIVTGNGGLNYVYLNDGGGGFSGGFSFGTDGDSSVALGDLDGDGLLDIVTGNRWEQNYVYLNGLRRATGLPDNMPYVNITRPITTNNANLYSTPVILDGPTIPITYTLFDSEGDIVRFIRTEYSPNGGGQWFPATSGGEVITNNLFTNIPAPKPICSTPGLIITDIHSDTQSTASKATISDLNVSISATHTFVGDLVFTLEHVNTGTKVTIVDQPGVPTSLYGCYGDNIDITLDDEALLQVEDQCASTAPTIDGTFIPNNHLNAFDGEAFGGTWKLTITDTYTSADHGTLVEWCLLPTSAPPEPHVFTWQADADLIKSDNVIFRIEAYQGFTGPGPYQRPYASAQTFPFRVEAAEWYARVINGTSPTRNAEIYYNGHAITTTIDGSHLTDRAGLLRLGDPAAGQPLVALARTKEQTTTRAAHNGWTYRTYITSLHLDNEGTPHPDAVGEPGQQLITVRQDNPLILFNIVASVEWDASDEYLAMLEDAFRKASDYLYDVTDGQMAFAQVTIYDNAQFWADADFQISTKNTVRPYAFLGGITSKDEAHTIRVGRFWSGDSGNEGNWNEPHGYRTLIHEFGHYALFLQDEYFVREFDGNGNFRREAPAACTHQDNVGPPATVDRDKPDHASLMYYQYNASELAGDDRWNEDCQHTEQHRLNGGSDWTTILKHYDGNGWDINTPSSRGSVMSGPDEFPSHLLPFPEIILHNSGNAGGPSVQVTVRDSENRPIQNALVALYKATNKGTMALDQGLTDRFGKITVYGTAAGDTVRAATFDGALGGSVLIDNHTSYKLSITPTSVNGLSSQAGQKVPYLSLVPSSEGDMLTLEVRDVAGSGNLTGIVIPGEGAGAPQSAPLAYSPAIGGYVGQVSFAGVGLGSGAVQVNGLAGGQVLSLNSDYNLQAVQAITSNHLYSEDGNFELHIPPGGVPADGYSTVLPTGFVPGPLPAGKQIIGSAYEVRLSGALTALDKDGLVRLHYHPEVMGVFTDTAIYFWEPGEGEWRPLGSEPSEVDKAWSVSADRLGIYALMGVQLEVSKEIYLPLILKPE